MHIDVDIWIVLVKYIDPNLVFETTPIHDIHVHCMQLNDLDTRTQILEKLWDVVGLLRLLGLGTGKFQFQSIC